MRTTPIAVLMAACAFFAHGAARADAPTRLDDGWRVADPAAQGWDPKPFAEAEAKIADGTWKGVTSLVVVHRGKLVHERYFNGTDRDTLHDTRSLTKSVTAMLVGAAIDRGLVADAQARVFALFGDKAPVRNPDPRKDAITFEDLLTMSSLLECNDENSFSSGNEERMYVSEDWIRFTLDLPIKGFAPWESPPARSPHGRAFAYCTAGSFLLGAAVERASGKPLETFAREVIEAPLGITRSTWNRAPDGTGMGGGGTRYRSRDLAKLGEMLRDDGRWAGKAVLSKAWTRAMLHVHAQARDDADYGYQTWRFRFPHRGGEQPAWAMSGNGGNYVFIVPELELVAVITSNAYNQRFAHPQSQGIFRDVVLAAMPPARDDAKRN
ncbi:serine hydrolase domain-containing protein [Dokdonella sp. MW10]|uniref:serine hydrolase domain-containing protein n=1 Tax=Dokdonella sp. MW10 TaxID=2992926 RepID=UPI003F80E880